MYDGLKNPTSTPPRRTIAAGASPWTYTNTSTLPERVVVNNGTVSAIKCMCDGSTLDSLGLTAGWFLLNPGESIEITWAILQPTLVVCPF